MHVFANPVTYISIVVLKHYKIFILGESIEQLCQSIMEYFRQYDQFIKDFYQYFPSKRFSHSYSHVARQAIAT